MKMRHQYQATPINDPYAEKRQFNFRLLVVFFAAMLAFGMLIARLYWMQIKNYDHYLAKSHSNRVSLLSVAPTRGEIIDRNGKVLARNYATFSLEIIPSRIEQGQSIENVIEELKQYVDITDDDLDKFKKFRIDYRKYDNIPLKLKLNNEEASKLASELYRFPGVEINARTFREYPYGELTSHFIGYIGRINQKEKDEIKENNLNALYRATTHIGKSGLEQYYEMQLHGTPGLKEVETDAKGNVIDVLQVIPPKTGKMLRLGMDIRVQQEASRIFGNRRGAMVAIDPQTGIVLAFVSKPTFDPNLFIDGIDVDNWNRLNNSWQRPLINRVTQGLYPPGSTFKPFMSMALLESKMINGNTFVYSPGSWSIPGTKHKFRDSARAGHGSVNLSKAIQVSSDTFFYQLGYRLGIDKTAKYLEPFGLGKKTGIDLPNEYIGILPSREWKEKRFAKRSEKERQWKPADMVSVSIGQGFNAYTPLQMAFATSILAMEGKVYRPHLVSQVIDHENLQSIVLDPEPVRTVNYRPEHFRYVKRAMQRVLQSGGTAAKVGVGLKYPMAGKTGTAQVVRIKQGASYNAAALAEQYRDHAWFISFAPVEKPQIAIAVILENGGWGVNAAPLARQLTDFYLSYNKDNSDSNNENNIEQIMQPQNTHINKPFPKTKIQAAFEEPKEPQKINPTAEDKKDGKQ